MGEAEGRCDILLLAAGWGCRWQETAATERGRGGPLSFSSFQTRMWRVNSSIVSRNSGTAGISWDSGFPGPRGESAWPSEVSYLQRWEEAKSRHPCLPLQMQQAACLVRRSQL